MARKQENKTVNDSAVIIWKEVGETPLEALEWFRSEEISRGRMELSDVPMTYAGRLDPMAEGELLILIGEECKKKEEYLGLNKEYEVEIVFGIETDTYDALGIAANKIENLHSGGGRSQIDEVADKEEEDIFSRISEEVTKKVVTLTQSYPPYSSQTVGGKQLHELARAGELPEEMPTKEVTIYSIEMVEHRKISAQELLGEIIEKISYVKGNFRQQEIISRWKEVLGTTNERNVFLGTTFKVRCSSGTYMRSLAHELGRKLGTGAFALSIIRTRIMLR